MARPGYPIGWVKVHPQSSVMFLVVATARRSEARSTMPRTGQPVRASLSNRPLLFRTVRYLTSLQNLGSAEGGQLPPSAAAGAGGNASRRRARAAVGDRCRSIGARPRRALRSGRHESALLACSPRRRSSVRRSGDCGGSYTEYASCCFTDGQPRHAGGERRSCNGSGRCCHRTCTDVPAETGNLPREPLRG